VAGNTATIFNHMRINSTIECYGTSEGVSHAWDTRGRGRKDKEQSDRIARATASYNPVTRDKVQRAIENERRVAKAIGGEMTPHKHPFDVLKEKLSIEVKTIFPGAKNDKITMHGPSLERKENFISENKIRKVFTVIIDERESIPRVYVAKGLGSFRLEGGSVGEVKSIKSLRDHIK
jgi:hypothetical protein